MDASVTSEPRTVAPQIADPIDAGEVAELIRARVEAAGSSFYRAMRILPGPRRAAMYAIYAFCREVDDIADEGDDRAAKRIALEAWRRELDALYDGRPTFLVARALAPMIRRFDLPKAEFAAIIDGMAMDAEADIQAPGEAELDLYCDRVASAVGRLSVRAFGCATPAADRVATALGRALQLTNILRDLAEDAARGRLYLPRELLVANGIVATDPALVLASPALPAVCEEIARRARGHFSDARAALSECPRRPMRPAALMLATYAAVLRRLERRGWHHPSIPVKVGKLTKIWLLLRHGLI